MFCQKCGNKIEKDTLFCQKCGTEVNNSRDNVSEIRGRQHGDNEHKGRNRTIIGILSFFVILAIIVIALMLSKISTKSKLKASLSLGEKYLSELNYDDAILVYTKAIEIEPRSEEAYIGLIYAYIGKGDYKQALAIVERGLDAVKNSERLYDLKEIIEHELSEGEEINEEKDEEKDVSDKTEKKRNFRIVATKGFYADGEARRELKYDDEGNCIAQYLYDKDGNSRGYTINSYDSQNRLTESISYSASGEITWKTYPEYDADGNKVKEIQYPMYDDNTYYEYDFEYDEKGNMVRETWYYDMPEKHNYSVEEYEYNEEGKPIDSRMIENGEVYPLYIYEYDESGKLIRQTWYDHNDLWTIDEYEYDTFGNVKKNITFNADGEKISETEYQYEPVDID